MRWKQPRSLFGQYTLPSSKGQSSPMGLRRTSTSTYFHILPVKSDSLDVLTAKQGPEHTSSSFSWQDLFIVIVTKKSTQDGGLSGLMVWETKVIWLHYFWARNKEVSFSAHGNQKGESGREGQKPTNHSQENCESHIPQLPTSSNGFPSPTGHESISVSVH